MDVSTLYIPLGARALVSLTGIVGIVAGVWYVDRKWDEEGSKAWERAKKDTPAGKEVVVKESELDAAFPFPWAFLMGWGLYAASYFLPIDGGTTLTVTTPGLVASAASLALAVIASVPMGDAVRNRKAGKKKVLGLGFVTSWLVLTVASGYDSDNVVPFALGAVSIIASMKILWKNRKMGDTWEQEGRPNPNPVVYNMGGPLFVFGWFLCWLGMAATPTLPAVASLPLYLNLRTLIAFISGCGMVPVVLFLDYAHDEGAEFIGRKYPGLGTDGRFFGKFLESPIPFLLFWTFFGLASFVGQDNQFSGVPTTREWLILANCVAQGIDAGVLIQTALYEGDMSRKNFWSVPFVGLFMLLATNVGKSFGGNAIYFSVPGAILIVAGQKTVFGDRKRGDYYMQNGGKPNPNPIVYSYGEILFMTGWILESYAMSLP